MGPEKLICCLMLIGGISNFADAQKSAQHILRRNALTIKDVEQGGWQMVFRGTSSNGHSVFHAWTLGQNTTPDKPATMERSHGLHYRNSIVKNWSNLGTELVKFAFYNEDKEVAYVIFNGKDSNLTNWFAKSRVIDSSWPDLNSAEDYNYFSIDGHFLPARHDRRFFINKYYNKCPKDRGHMVVINSQSGAVCLWDSHAIYPQFLYSKINSSDYWNRRMFGTADYMAVLIK